MMAKIKVKDKLEDETLDLSWCDLKEVPVREIATIKKASHLDLSNNQLISIPETIVILTHIVKLDLSRNLLTEIPENIGEMKQLKYLDLYGNQISRLPLSIGDLKNLKWLDLKDNPLTAAVASVAGPCSNTSECQRCARSIVSYLTYIRQTIEVEKKKRNEASTAVSVSTASNKKESKKKKKKNNVKDGEQNQKESYIKLSTSHDTSTHEFNSLSHDHRIHSNIQDKDKLSESSIEGVSNSLCRLIYSILTFIISLGILSIFIIILLPRFNQPLSDRVVNYLQDQMKLPVKDYQKWGIEKFDASSDILMEFLNYTKKLASKTFAKVVGEQHKCCGN